MVQLIEKRLWRLHYFFRDQLLYPLALSSLLALAIFLGRVYISQKLTFIFLMWNLFLAWVPYLCSLWIASLHQRFPRRWWYLIAPGVVWLLFLPNAPYVVTDLWHLTERPPVPVWYDIGMLVTLAWTGCFLALASLSAIHSVVKDYWGHAMSWLFVFGAIGLSGLGIYLGRFLNWNSWDLILRPHSVLADVVTRFANPVRNPQPFGVVVMFAAFLLVCYVMFVSIERRQVERVHIE